MLKNLCICWRKVIMDKKTTRLLSQYFNTYYTTYPKGDFTELGPLLFGLWIVSGFTGPPLGSGANV